MLCRELWIGCPGQRIRLTAVVIATPANSHLAFCFRRCHRVPPLADSRAASRSSTRAAAAFLSSSRSACVFASCASQERQSSILSNRGFRSAVGIAAVSEGNPPETAKTTAFGFESRFWDTPYLAVDSPEKKFRASDFRFEIEELENSDVSNVDCRDSDVGSIGATDCGLTLLSKLGIRSMSNFRSTCSEGS